MIPFLITLQEFAVLFLVVLSLMIIYVGIHNHIVYHPSERIRLNTGAVFWYSIFTFNILMWVNSVTPELF